jgi:ubiquinone/menaquinone biosynthesis C-methylase UbiE
MRRDQDPITESHAENTAGNGARQVFDQHAAKYEQAVDRSISFTGRNASFFAQRKVEVLHQLLASRGRDLSQATVLDVGCGTGMTDRHLVSQVRTLHGVDIAEEMLIQAERNVPKAHFQCYDGKTLPFAANSFDVVIAICVLHHVPVSYQSRFIEEMDRVALPGGLIAIFEHNPANLLTRRAVRGCELDLGVILLSVGDVERLLTAVGSRIIGHEYFLFTPFGGRVGLALDRLLRWVPLGGQHVVLAEATGHYEPFSA